MPEYFPLNRLFTGSRFIVFKTIPILCVLLLSPSFSKAQKSIFEDMNYGVKFGTSSLLTEMPTDFSGGINEFDNKAGITFDLEISKHISPKWELGVELVSSLLTGENQEPLFSAEGAEEGFPNPVFDPVEYQNRLFGPKIFFRYYFKFPDNKNKKVYLNPFVRFGAGFVEHKSYFKYIGDNDIISGKNSHTISARLSNMVYTIGGGVKTNLSPTFFLQFAFDLNIVSHDFLDVVHNYTPDGNRQDLFALYSELKVGIFYRNSEKERALRKRDALKEYLPFGR